LTTKVVSRRACYFVVSRRAVGWSSFTFVWWFFWGTMKMMDWAVYCPKTKKRGVVVLTINGTKEKVESMAVLLGQHLYLYHHKIYCVVRSGERIAAPCYWLLTAGLNSATAAATAADGVEGCREELISKQCDQIEKKDGSFFVAPTFLHRCLRW
jgi:hypothetical protein